MIMTMQVPMIPWATVRLTLGVSLALGLAGSVWPPNDATAQAPATLVAAKVTTPPRLDGTGVDPAWAAATPLEVPVMGPPLGFATLTLKALYTDRDIYLLAKWPDKTMNVEHKPYTYDGTKWTRPEGPLEDRFAIMWNISARNFEKAGCAILCHAGTAYPDKQPRMHTNAPDEFTDEWHWKAARANPMGYVDDKYVDNTVKPDDDEAGHHADGGTRVYTGNRFKDGAPSFVWKTATPTVPPHASPAQARLFLLDADKAPYGRTNPLTGKPWAKGDTVPVAILQQPSGSNADLRAVGVWKEEFWTLEMARALDTGENAAKGEKKLDVVFEPAKTYFFGISVFDNSEAANHSFSGPVALVFK
jgi:hypothetical protein